MKHIAKSGLNLLGILIVALVPAFYTFQYLSEWPLIEISGIRGREYSDSLMVLSAASCENSGFLNQSTYLSAEPACFYTYGTALLTVLQFFHLSATNLYFVAIVAITSIIAICISQYKYPDKLRYQIYFFLTLCSPGVWLLLERGNFDWLIFVLIFAAGFSIKKQRYILSSSLIAATALFKFYTFPILLVPFIFASKQSRILITLIGLSIFPIVLVEMQNASLGGSAFSLSATFGINWIGLSINALSNRLGGTVSLDPGQSLGLGLAVSALTLFALKGAYKRSTTRKSLISSAVSQDPIFIVLSLTYIICYFAGSNYHYRLIFLVGAVIRIQFLLKEKRIPRSAYFVTLTSLWLTFFYFSYSSYGTEILRLIGNLSQYIVAISFTYLVSEALYVKSKPNISVERKQ